MFLTVLTAMSLVHSMYATQIEINKTKTEVKKAKVEQVAKLSVQMDKNELVLKFGQPREIISSRFLNKTYRQMIYSGKYCAGNTMKYSFNSCWVILSSNDKVESWSSFKPEYE